MDEANLVRSRSRLEQAGLLGGGPHVKLVRANFAELDEVLFEEKRLELQRRLIDLNEQADNLWGS